MLTQKKHEPKNLQLPSVQKKKPREINNLPELVWQMQRGIAKPLSMQVCDTSAPIGSPL